MFRRPAEAVHPQRQREGATHGRRRRVPVAGGILGSHPAGAPSEDGGCLRLSAHKAGILLIEAQASGEESKASVTIEPMVRSMLSPMSPNDPEWQIIEDVLRQRNVPQDLRGKLRAALWGDFESLLLYGSWARGDAHAKSDLDILVLNHSGTISRVGGEVSLSSYSAEQLQQASGTLFGHHLARDGVVIVDPNGTLAKILVDLEKPIPSILLARIRELTPVLDPYPSELLQYIEGLTQVARYLLRSSLYAEALDQGQPCYSVQEIAQRKREPALALILSSHKSIRPKATVEGFEDLRRRLADILGDLKRNHFGGMYGLIEGAWMLDRDLSNLATLALSNGRTDLPYDELPKVVL